MAKIVSNQYNTELRNELIHTLKSELAESNSCALRKTYIFFCKSGVNTFSRQFFHTHFYPNYIALSKDKVAAVRMEFASSLITIKPCFDSDPVTVNDLMSILTNMHSDPDRDVVEAVEVCDYQLLQMKKRTREQEKALNAVDAQRVATENSLK